MDKPDTTLEILALGRFSIFAHGTAVATDWPDEASKLLFCSLLSPLDQLFTWDRICRSMWGVPESRTGRRLLEETVISTLNSFLIKELGFNQLITGPEGIRLDQQNINLDALEFHRSVVAGLSLLTLGNPAAALEKFNRANSLYVGSYLPGMRGKIIASTRRDLESLHRIVLVDGLAQVAALSVRTL